MAFMSRIPIFAIFTLLSFIAIQVLGAQGASSCKAVPGDPNWPSVDVWAQLNQTTGGQLLQPVPPGAVCHPGHPNYNTTDCVIVQYEWSNEYFHQRDPVSVEWNNWNNDSCLPDPDVPCSSAGYPLYVINATTAQHVKAGIDFGKLFCLPQYCTTSQLSC
jgi:hypothetical protein